MGTQVERRRGASCGFQSILLLARPEARDYQESWRSPSGAWSSRRPEVPALESVLHFAQSKSELVGDPPRRFPFAERIPSRVVPRDRLRYHDIPGGLVPMGPAQNVAWTRPTQSFVEIQFETQRVPGGK